MASFPDPARRREHTSAEADHGAQALSRSVFHDTQALIGAVQGVFTYSSRRRLTIPQVIIDDDYPLI
jgi:hypothetical protein